MQTLEVVLAGLRVTLLAACGVSLSACAKCKNPEPVLASNGQPTGYVRCSDGAVDRAMALECPVLVTAFACRGDETQRACETDADCTAGPNGFCKSGQRGGDGMSTCGCVYPCKSDSDCGADQVCMCPDVDYDGPSVATCVPATCKTNGDCESGECGAIVFNDGCGTSMELACRGPGDECRSHKSCEEDCAPGFKCREATCKAGRPLTVDEDVRVAELANERWGDVRLDGLPRSTERAEYWLGVARMEHASVASFARFVGELLRFGAPPRLLVEAFAAAADEVRHAEQAFAIASAYAGVPIGPGALQVDDLGPAADPELFVTRLITEGCVGETLGVADVLDMLAGDVDPGVRPHLEQVAADETRHAALAWQTLRWFRSRVDPSVIERAFDQALRSVGRVDDHAARIRATAIASVIEPCRQQCQAG